MSNYLNNGFIIKTNDIEETIYIPYNTNNIVISEENIINLLDKYGIKINKINHMEYMHQAFVHKSYCKKDIYPEHILNSVRNEINSSKLLELFENSYERLEYFGDRVLKIIISMYLFHRYPKQDEGFMTRLQIKIEDKKNLSQMSKELELGQYFIISKQIEQAGGRNLEKLHEDIFEAFIGGLFLSNGFEICCYLITNLLETLIDYSEKLYCDNNYKDILMKVYHQNKWNYPKYMLLKYEGLPHERKYIMGVISHNNKNEYIGYGMGNSKKESEQNAAKMALIKLNQLNEDQYSINDIFYPKL